MFENQDDIDLALNNLEHAGVKGMRWGKRKASNPSDQKPKMSRKEKNKAILKAREEVAQSQYEIDAINRAYITTSSAKGKKDLEKKFKNSADIYNNNIEMANKRTTGEKFATALMIGSLGASAAVLLAPR
jgi:hypothetical protein